MMLRVQYILIGPKGRSTLLGCRLLQKNMVSVSRGSGDISRVYLVSELIFDTPLFIAVCTKFRYEQETYVQ